MIDTTEIERVIIGCMMVQPGFLKKINGTLRPEYFSCKAQQTLFEIGQERYQKGKPYDLSSIALEGQDKGLSPVLIASFTEDLPIGLKSHAEQLREAATKNRFQKKYNRIASLNVDPAEKCRRFAELNRESGSTEKIGTNNTKPIKVISCSDLLTKEFPPRKNLVDSWLPEQGLCLLHAYRGVGKTHVSIGVAAAVATGSPFLRWNVQQPAGVLFIDGEMPGVVLQERIAQTIAGMDGTGEAPFNIITPDLQELGMPDLATVEGQLRLEPYLTDEIKLIIIDNVSTLCRSTQENRGDTWVPVQEWALKLRARGKSVLLVHHDGKGGQQRGTSRKEDILDTVIQLKHPSDYTPDQGACFEIYFRKSRGIFGDDVKPFEAKLVDMGGVQGWITRDIEDSLQEKVKRLLDDGYQQKDIAEELGITKGYVSKLCKKNKAEK